MYTLILGHVALRQYMCITLILGCWDLSTLFFFQIDRQADRQR